MKHGNIDVGNIDVGNIDVGNIAASCIFHPQYYSPDAKWVTSASLTCLALSYTILISGKIMHGEDVEILFDLKNMLSSSY